MTKNLGSIDRIIRIVLGISFGVLYFTGVTTGTLGIVLAVLGGIFIATSLISWCPIYAVLGIKTCPLK
jgi:drug/metabolite transporter superfamily protein YnfA